ncbi:MAG: extracellular solute-binding protein [Eisenbergiella sp.]
MGRLAVNGAFADLLPHAEGRNYDKDFVDAFVNDAYYEGNLLLFLWPFRSDPSYQQNRPGEMGCEIPTTWDELKEVANKCTIVENGETKRYGLSVPFDQWEFFALIQQAGGKFFNEDQTGLGCLEDGTAKEAFSFMKDLQDSGALYTTIPPTIR